MKWHRSKISPARAVFAGLVAGAFGSFAQDVFFAATKKIAPKANGGGFVPPEREQRNEQATQTVARRTVEGLMQRGPIENKSRAGRAVHYAFGAGWGAIYGLARGSMARPGDLAAALGFGTLVWGVADNLILPAFKLSGWPKDYPLSLHAYAWVAHAAYGLAVNQAFEALAPTA